MEWITKHEVKLANTFCKKCEPTRAETNKLDFWTQDEKQLQKWKIIDYIAVQNLKDHWPVITYVRLPEKKEGWRYGCNSALQG